MVPATCGHHCCLVERAAHRRTLTRILASLSTTAGHWARGERATMRRPYRIVRDIQSFDSTVKTPALKVRREDILIHRRRPFSNGEFHDYFQRPFASPQGFYAD